MTRLFKTQDEADQVADLLLAVDLDGTEYRPTKAMVTVEIGDNQGELHYTQWVLAMYRTVYHREYGGRSEDTFVGMVNEIAGFEDADLILAVDKELATGGDDA